MKREKYTEKVAKWVTTEAKYVREVEQAVVDYYRHASDKETHDMRLEVLEEVAPKYGIAAEQFAEMVADWEVRWEAFYADKKTVAALMACTH